MFSIVVCSTAEQSSNAPFVETIYNLSSQFTRNPQSHETSRWTRVCQDVIQVLGRQPKRPEILLMMLMLEIPHHLYWVGNHVNGINYHPQLVLAGLECHQQEINELMVKLLTFKVYGLHGGQIYKRYIVEHWPHVYQHVGHVPCAFHLMSTKSTNTGIVSQIRGHSSNDCK